MSRDSHDRRYAVECSKIKSELGWRPSHEFSAGLDATIGWYRDNTGWIDRIRSGAYKDWIARNYTNR